ncbi:hypothetical protein AGOR_G00008820 [Albula goreensis]|uniref:Ribosomal RNA-processing protein 14/surfeit locus protein 6 C-terminal domain-containing protein n=1 Tax=Albula goreensis TaxID=1534307 RepID=A0A8T3E5M1_9TELE|nr:hypothetical protein AGOR_G00008820 [Albula goreensis]
MASLASKDTYLQKLGSKVCASHNQEPRKRPFVPFRHGGDAGAVKKKKGNKPKHSGAKNFGIKDRKTPAKTGLKPAVHPGQTGNSDTGQSVLKTNAQNGTGLTNSQGRKGGKSVASSFFTVDILRQRLHEKIEETRCHGNSKVVAGKSELTLVFNKVEVGGEKYVDKAQKKKEKKKQVKGNLTPLTGKNYKQLLSRVEARKAKLEELRTKDENKAKEVEEKMKWTNVLYKAEGLKIKDDEDMLRASLKKKEKMRSQRKKRWDQRSVNLLEKIQNKQDKRRRNIQKQKRGKMEKRKEKARKKGRILPEDLKKA